MKTRAEIETQRLCAEASMEGAKRRRDPDEFDVAAVVHAVLGWVLDADDESARSFGLCAARLQAVVDQVDSEIRDAEAAGGGR